jgi:hypothetical protein
MRLVAAVVVVVVPSEAVRTVGVFDGDVMAFLRCNVITD